MSTKVGRTTALRRALDARFFPALTARGFVLDRRGQPQATRGRRLVAEDRVALFELQWDKYGRSRFVVHLGSCSAAGLTIGDRAFSSEDVLPPWCPDAATLRPGRGMSTRAWFRQDRPWIRRLFGGPPDRPPAEVVDELLTLWPEAEDYWLTGESTSHVRRWR